MVNTANDVEAMYRRVDFEDWDGDAPSDLDNPSIYGKAGETYRVRLLIGKTYDVEGSQPFDIVAKSDERIEVTEIGAGRCEIVWPVTFTVAEGRAPTGRPRLGATWNDGGKSFYVMPNPSWLRGAVTWTDNYCCDVWGDGTNFTYACDNTCTCEGCTVYGSYWYEGYGLPVWGIPCGCHYVPDQGPVGVSISFDHPAVIYEDAYTNLPDVVVHPVRSNAVLRCSVSGGTYGGTFSVTLNAAAQQKLSKVRGNTLPQNVRIEPGSNRSYEVEYSVLEPSGSVGDIGAEARFLEDFHNKTHTNDASMTAGGGLYPNWSPGRLEWKIPIGWGRLQTDLDHTRNMAKVEYERNLDESSRPLLIGGRTDKYKQVFTIEEDGTSKVEKFGH